MLIYNFFHIIFVIDMLLIISFYNYDLVIKYKRIHILNIIY
jgi:hypothetical protein